MSIEKPKKPRIPQRGNPFGIPRKSKNLNVNEDNGLLLFADELKKQYPHSNNIYFSLLKQGVSKSWLHATQSPFLYAVEGWSNVLINILSKLSSSEQRIVILRNLNDEHGNGDIKKCHTYTFTQFLKSTIDTSAPPPRAKCVDNFITSIMETQDVVKQLSIVGIIEYIYAYLSIEIGICCSKLNIKNEHYKEHTKLDIEHALDIFRLLQKSFPERLDDIKQYMTHGITIFMDLFTQMADIHDHKIFFSSVIEDSNIEIDILQNLNINNPRICIIGSAGCTVLHIMSKIQGEFNIHIVDSNKEQMYLFYLKLSALEHFSEQPLIYHEFLKGKQVEENIKSILNILQKNCEVSHQYWCQKLNNVYDGVISMGYYEHIFKKLNPPKGLPLSGGSIRNFETAFEMKSLINQFGKRAKNFSDDKLSSHYEKYMYKNCNDYFLGIFNGDYNIPPSYIYNIDSIINNKPKIRYDNANIVHILEKNQYDFIDLSNITDWMSKQECDELIVLCKKALSPNGKLLMRRLNGQFHIDDLRAFGFDRVVSQPDDMSMQLTANEMKAAKNIYRTNTFGSPDWPFDEPSRGYFDMEDAENKRTIARNIIIGLVRKQQIPIVDKSGIYSETCIFGHSSVSTNNELKVFENTMCATYPLKDKMFKIQHGSIYLEFFNRIGETIYKDTKDEYGIIESTCALILRDIPNDKAWYIADLKVHPKVQGQRKPLELLSHISSVCLKRCSKLYGIEMCPKSDSDISQSRIYKLLTISLGSNIDFTTLHIFQLTYEQMVEFELDLVYISLENIKGLVLVPENVRLPVLHASPKQYVKSGDKYFSYPQVGHIHMLCAVSGSKISNLLSKNMVPSKAWIVHYNMHTENYDPFWKFLNTSEI
jgi:pyrroloquinoline-quinone synthase